MRRFLLALTVALSVATIVPAVTDDGGVSAATRCADSNKFNPGNFDGPPKHKAAECK